MCFQTIDLLSRDGLKPFYLSLWCLPSVYNGLVGFASPLVTQRESDCVSPTSSAQSSFAAGVCFIVLTLLSLTRRAAEVNPSPLSPQPCAPPA